MSSGIVEAPARWRARALVAAAFLLPAGLAACGGEAEGGTSTPERPGSQSRLRVVGAKAVEHRPSWEVSGALEAGRSARAAFLIGGRLAEIRVKRGDFVEEGQVLARLDTSEVGAGVAQANAAVAAAEAQLELATDALARVERLSEQGAVAEAQLVKVRQQRDAAAAMREQARGALRMAGVKSTQHVLRAPIAGTILDAPDAPGVIVGPGIPQFDIADLRRLRVKVSLPSEAAGAVRPGQPAAIRARGGLEIEGRVALVLPALDADSHRLPVEVEVDAPEESVGLANSFVQVRLTAQQTVSAVEIPATAIVRGEETTVFVVDGGVARSREVSVLASEGDRAVVLGIDAGADVIDLPDPDLADGAPVG